MRIAALLGLLAIAVAVGMLWFVGRGPRRIEPALAPEPTAATEVRQDIALLDALAETKGADSLPLSGTIVALDELGIEHDHEDGRIFLALVENGKGRSYIGAEVRGGRWSVDLARLPLASKPWLAIESCSLGQRVALPEHAEPQPLPGPDAEGLELRVRWLPDLVIHVKARDDGRELDEVLLDGVPDDDRGPRDPPGLFTGIRFGRSPVRIQRGDERWLGPILLHARSSEHAWAQVEVDPESREVELLLDPAGTLELAVDAHPWHGDEEISLVRSGPEPRVVLEAALRLMSNRVLEGIAPGTYSAQARCRGRLVGSQPVEIVAGELTSATLVVEAPSTELVPLEGKLTVPAQWKLDDVRLTIGPAGLDTDDFEPGPISISRSEMTPEPGSSERVRWSAGLVPVGRYQAILLPLRFRTDLDTGSAGTSEALVDVPPPTRVSIAWVDALTGERMDHRQFGAGVHSTRDGRLCWLRSDSESEDPLVVPSGRLHLIAHGRGYELSRRTVLLEPGSAEVALALWHE